MLINSERKAKNKTSKFQLLNTLIFKKYRILKLISEGIFGQIYIVINENNRNYYAMKVENQDSNIQILEQEAYNLLSIKGLGIPELITFGKVKNYKILIEQLLSKSLAVLFTEYNYKFSMKDICLISLQLIDRIELIHSKTLVHRDIKPENFLIGTTDPNIIYLTEFGLCTKYCSSKTGKHIIPRFRGTFTGTLKFSSANAQKGNQQSRRDDIESLGYNIIYFMKGKLPWDNLNQNYNDREKYLKTYAIKKYMPIERLCKELPSEMKEYFKHVKNLKFQEKPNYEYLRNLFKKILANEGVVNYENINFSWVNSSNDTKTQFKKKRTLSPKTRLFLKIKNKLEINREIDSDPNRYKNGNRTPIQNNRKTYYTNNEISLSKLNNTNLNANDFGLNKNNKENQQTIQKKKQLEKENGHNIKNELINIKNNKNNPQILNKKKNYDPKNIDLIHINNNIDKKIEHFNNTKNSNNYFNLYNNNKYILSGNNKMNHKNLKTFSNKLIESSLQFPLNKNKINLTNIYDNKNNFTNYDKSQKLNKNSNNQNISNDNNLFMKQYHYKNINSNRLLNLPGSLKNEILMKDSFQINNNKYQNLNNKNLKISNNFNNNFFNNK